MRTRPRARHPGAPPNDTTWRTLVYALFGILTMGWIGLWMLTPDLLVAAIVLAIAGVCIRLAIGRGRWPTVMMLGILLGLGCLAKAALFPFGVFVLGTLAVLLRRRRGGLAQVAAAAAIFLAASAPQIVYASRLDAGGRAAVLSRMQQHGAQAIVAESPAPGVSIDGWERLPSAGVSRPDLIVYAGPR